MIRIKGKCCKFSARKEVMAILQDFKKCNFQLFMFHLQIDSIYLGFINKITVEALLMNTPLSGQHYFDHLYKTLFYSTLIQTLYFYILVSSQLQLWTPFSRPKYVPLQTFHCTLTVSLSPDRTKESAGSYFYFFPFRLRPRLVQLTCMHGLCTE